LVGSMGIQEDINWLKADVDHIRTFMAIAKRGTATIRAIKDDLHIDDWWPVKYQVNNLVSRGLVGENEGRYELTEAGRNVYEAVKTVAVELGQV